MIKAFLTYFLKIYDKLILGIIFSSLFLTSCDCNDPYPAPEYGVVPLYGVPSAQVEPLNSRE